MQYYDGTKLLSMKDINGNDPEIYICTSNRSAGKTTFFSRLLINRWLKKKQKFGLIYRFNYELNNVAQKFFNDVGGLFFPSMTMTATSQARGLFCSLSIDGVECGYALPLNAADALKKYSHFFNDIETLMFDEFQPETGQYAPNEIAKFQSLHTSIARGHGKQVRRVPVIMISNPITLINPYYCAMKISSRLTKDTKFLRGDGFVLEQGFVQSASDAIRNSSFMQAFEDSKYTAYASQGVYLDDNLAFVDNVEGRSTYFLTFKYMDKYYAIRLYTDKGIAYCTDKVDMTFPTKISATTDDHQINFVMLKQNDLTIRQIKYLFAKGCFRFRNLDCKEALIQLISY